VASRLAALALAGPGLGELGVRGPSVALDEDRRVHLHYEILASGRPVKPRADFWD